MAAPNPSTTTAPGTTHLDPLSTSQPSSEHPVEMTDLDAASSSHPAAAASHNLNDVSIPETSPLTSLFPPATAEGDIAAASSISAGVAASTGHTISAAGASTEPATKDPAASSSSPAVSPLSAQSQVATGADSIVPAAGEKEVPVLVITLLLTSGARHPYKIDEKYLTKRNVTIPATTESGRKDPFSISVYTLKELILREWREEWEAQPSSPSSIRLIYFGRLLDDKAALKGMTFVFVSLHVSACAY
jgi:Ubiquitin-2 like Rad60 SUMO-like